MQPLSLNQATSRDPVCGKDVVLDPAAPSSHATVHRGLTFHFCSAQCLERFRQTPALYTGGQRSADLRPMPKRRTLRIAAGDASAADAACRSIGALMGVSAVHIEGHKLRVEYDLLQVGLVQIEAAAAAAGLTLKAGLHGLRRSLWKFAEQNELDNAAHAGTGACCSRPPARLK